LFPTANEPLFQFTAKKKKFFFFKLFCGRQKEEKTNKSFEIAIGSISTE
jgi:hypothetical protein